MKYHRHRDADLEDPAMLPTDKSIQYVLSMLNPTHQAFREIEDHLDSIMPEEVIDSMFDDEF